VSSETGPRGAWLEDEVARIFRLLGGRTRKRLLVEHYEVDVWAVLRKGPFELTYVVECKEYDATRLVTDPEMSHFAAKVAAARRAGKADRGIFVTTSGFTKHARASAADHGTQCLTLRELVNHLVDFDEYLTDVGEAFESSNLARWYVDQTVSEFEDYEGLALVDRHQALHFPALTYVATLLEDLGEEPLAILGNFGTGKSTFCEVYRAALARKALSSSDARIPVLIDLREFRAGLDIQQVIVRALQRLPGVDINPKVCLELQKIGRFQFLLDGLDEMVSRVDRSVINESLREIDSLRTAGNNRYMLTCRTHFFQERIADEFLTNYRVLYLTEWRPPEIRLYFRKRFGHSGDSRCNQVLMNPRIADLARTPLLLDILLETDNPDDASVNLFRLLARYTDQLIIKQSSRRGTIMPAAQRRSFMLALARHMRLEGASQLHFSELYDVAREFCGHSDASRLDQFDADARTCTFITRDSQGNYSFRSETFFDFFSADALSDEVERGNRQLLEAVDITPEIIDLIVGRSLSPSGIQHLHEWSTLSDAGRLSQNAVSLLCALGETPQAAAMDHYKLSDLPVSTPEITAATDLDTKLTELAHGLSVYARRHLRDVGLPDTDMDDAINEVLARYWVRRQRDPATLESIPAAQIYLTRALRNLILDRASAEHRGVPVRSIDSLDVKRELEKIYGELDADMEVKTEEVGHLVDQLPDKQRQLVICVAQGSSIGEASKQVGVSVRTAKVLLSSALRHLRASMEG
jgi:RNA polymerase sigma factor (sigma-70 family)